MHTHPTSRPVRFRSLVGIALLLALAALASLAGGANAGTQVPLIDFRILKLDCAEDPGQVPDGVTPEGCTPVEGVSFTIDVEDGDTLSCTTNDEGRCQVQVPSEANVIVTEDESTGTAGYTPRENPIETQAVTEFAGAIFVNVADEPPTTDLPDTGAGPITTQGGGMLVTTLAVIAGLLAIGGATLRRVEPRAARIGHHPRR